MPRTGIFFSALCALALSKVATLKIEGQLTTIKNDCYERLAIGQRHESKDIYKTSNVSTVFECQLLCTEEKEKCKSFSFGIGVKGNASCELSTNLIKETADLRPIGTKGDNDYDLYIKKLGCTLVIDKNNPAFNHYKPQNKPGAISYNEPESTKPPYGASPPNKPVDASYGYSPSQSGPSYGPVKPVDSAYGSAPTSPSPSKPVDSGYGSSPTPSYSPPSKPTQEVGHVQTLVSISSGPNKPVLHPYHDILVSNGLYNYARPPFRPPALNSPYDRPQRPSYDRPNEYDSRPVDSNLVLYGDRPLPDKYASYIPRPDRYDYYRPRPHDYDRPNPFIDDYMRPRPPSDGYGLRPQGPSLDRYDTRPPGPSGEYSSRPPRPPLDAYDPRPQGPPSDYNSRPPRPPLDGYNSRPQGPPGDYNSRPPRPPLGGYDSRPQGHPGDYNARPPRPPLDGYDSRPQGPPSDYNSRPQGPPSDYNSRPPSRPPPNGYDSRPQGPPSDYNPRPPRPPPDGYDSRPQALPGDYDSRPPHPPPGDYNSRPPLDGYDSKPSRPPPNDYNPRPPPNDYSKPQRPSGNDYNSRPQGPPPSDGYNSKPPRPTPSDYDSRPQPNDYNNRPTSSTYDRPNPPNSGYDSKPSNGYKPSRPDNSDYDSNPNSGYRPDGYKPQKPINEYLFAGEIDRYDTRGVEKASGYEKPGAVSKPGGEYDNAIKGSPKPKDPHAKPIITQSIGPHGESITSIITEIEDACFRRVLAGKRVTRALVKRAVLCESVDDCQRECAEEKRFPCEGFNYRLDPTGRGKGHCELLDIPLSRLDIGRDLYPDRDYDYYERDRNAARSNCRPYGYYPAGPSYDTRRYDQQPYDWWDDERRYGQRRPRPQYGYEPPPPPPCYNCDDGYRPSANRRGDFAYHDSHHYDHAHDYHYEHYNHGPPPYESYEPYLPPRRPYHDRDKSYWGYGGNSYGTNFNVHEFEKKNYYLPPPPDGGNKYWGQYGGSYGDGGGANLQYSGYGHSQSFDFWGLNKYEEKFHNYQGGSYLPQLPYKPPSNNGGPSYLPELPPKSPGSYLPQPGLKPPFVHGHTGYLPSKPPSYLPIPKPNPPDFYDNSILPAEPRYPYNRDFLKDECSLRMAAGFRLHKLIVKKFASVPNIYECELLCFKEKDFPCAAYAFRYSTSPNAQIENCYLSNRNYKELDYYTDLEPDRNFDVYTMNNMKKCEQPVAPRRDDSECFWRIRSGQRLDHKVIRDSLSVKSIVECQLACIKSVRFTCRAFSFRYGSFVAGGSVDNCLLTDWPYYELNPRSHFVPELGFEIYERGSFGHGCEPNHFGIKGRPWTSPATRIDQLCYIGFGSPATLLKQATRKELQVATEQECKAECSKLRENTLFQCMSLSFSATSPKWEANCKLSDILQRDLLPNVDFESSDPDSWLFAWDNYNPECRAVADKPVHRPKEHGYDDGISDAVATWRVYSVSGWPCRRGSACKQNQVAGFWYCELEGGDADTWDYCCKPEHQCGFSEGFQYQWCYVGPARTQWRKCSNRYYPYVHNLIDRLDPHHPSNNYLPEHRPPNDYLPEHRPPSYLPEHRPPHRPGIRPERPPAPPTAPPPRPSLDEYEMQFEEQFLDPPKPGGFGQPRHWPLSYLHKELPPNTTDDSEPRLMKLNPKYAAIQNLIDVIKSNDLKNVQYQITNETNKAQDVLFVKIPLPTNFTEVTGKKSEKMVAGLSGLSAPIDLLLEGKNNTKRSGKALLQDRPVPLYRRSFITRTNITSHRRSNFKL